MSAPQLKHLHTPQQRERLRNRLKEIDRQLEGRIVVPQSAKHKEKGEGLSARRMGRYAEFLREDVKENQGLLKKEAARIKATLEDGTVAGMTKADRTRTEKLAKESEDYLRTHLVPDALYHLHPRHPDFKKAVKACEVHMTPTFQFHADRYRNARLALNPDDEVNIESLRPKT